MEVRPNDAISRSSGATAEIIGHLRCAERAAGSSRPGPRRGGTAGGPGQFGAAGSAVGSAVAGEHRDVVQDVRQGLVTLGLGGVLGALLVLRRGQDVGVLDRDRDDTGERTGVDFGREAWLQGLFRLPWTRPNCGLQSPRVSELPKDCEAPLPPTDVVPVSLPMAIACGASVAEMPTLEAATAPVARTFLITIHPSRTRHPVSEHPAQLGAGRLVLFIHPNARTSRTPVREHAKKPAVPPEQRADEHTCVIRPGGHTIPVDFRVSFTNSPSLRLSTSALPERVRQRFADSAATRPPLVEHGHGEPSGRQPRAVTATA